MFLKNYHFLPQKSLYQLFWDIEVPRSDVFPMTGASRFAPTGSRDCSAQCF